jgi:maltooligosyltrehalose trehalohydrolase
MAYIRLPFSIHVVYNHLGPEGNYTADFGPYFTDRYRTPWGRALNFDGPYSDPVRRFFVENALFWFAEFHVDALRLDAVHAIVDMSARHILRELSDEVEAFARQQGKKCILIAESNLNDVRMISPREQGGYAVDAQWLDDMHHCMHTLLTGESDGYYRDFGTIDQFVTCLREGFVYSGQYSAFRRRRHGNSSAGIPASQFVVFSQNHDQIGNRMRGERLLSLVAFEGAKLAAGIEILTPHIPMLFMGEEYAEDSPFQYFVSHSDAGLIEAVRKGRRVEFAQFDWSGEPPDPQSPETFEVSRLRWETRSHGRHATMLAFYTELLGLRKRIPACSHLHRSGMKVDGSEDSHVISMIREHEGSRVLVFMNFHVGIRTVNTPIKAGKWRKILDSADPRWSGPGSVLPDAFENPARLQVGGHAIAVFEQESL